ncbi:hypothetical protein PsorP6_001592 [Peronosclerospora sorghi]|uniref:Uncharacterized protein n=1 Tax=Peronosclerospora sorghi TaxID=230839 RepID=A0ACC0WSP6_9STRA|nr:hypothetical protein PsorP6_001592 [Peronosclerospora sorghi]
MNHLRVFGSQWYVRGDESKRSKLDPKAHRCIFLGYAVGSKAYRVWDLDEERLVTTRTVQLDERPPSPYLNLTDACQPATIINLDVDDKSTSTPTHAPQPFQPDIDMEVESSVLKSRTHDLPAPPSRGRIDAIVPVNSDDSRSTSIVPRHLSVPDTTQLEVPSPSLQHVPSVQRSSLDLPSSQSENRLVFNGGGPGRLTGPRMLPASTTMQLETQVVTH